MTHSTILSVYFLPIWFQSIDGVSAQNSGIRLLPVMLSLVLASILGGLATSKIGYYTPFGIIGSVIMTVGAGLLTTLEVDSGKGKWIGFQVLYGFGMGLCFQVPNIATQAVLPLKDVPIGTALMFFSQLLGASVFISAGENVLGNQLVQRLSGLPGFDPSLVTSGGATTLLDSLPSSQRHKVLIAYNESLRRVFQIGLILSALSVLGYSCLEWRSTKKKPEIKSEDKGVHGVREEKNEVGAGSR